MERKYGFFTCPDCDHCWESAEVYCIPDTYTVRFIHMYILVLSLPAACYSYFIGVLHESVQHKNIHIDTHK